MNLGQNVHNEHFIPGKVLKQHLEVWTKSVKIIDERNIEIKYTEHLESSETWKISI